MPNVPGKPLWHFHCSRYPRMLPITIMYFRYLGVFATGPFSAVAAQLSFSGFQSPRAALCWTAFLVTFSLPMWLLLRANRWGKAAGWIALALAGQACSLQLLWAGPELRLQLFYGWQVLLKSYQGIFLLALLVQTGIVLWAIKARWAQVKRLLRNIVTLPALAVALALECYAATTIEPGVARAFVGKGFIREAAMHATKAGLGLLVLAVGAGLTAFAATSIPESRWANINTYWQRLDKRRLPWFCALWVVVVSSLLAWLALGRMPHVPDEVGYLFQAKYFSIGRLYLQPPADSSALSAPFQLADGSRWYNVVPPGWPAILAVGVRVSVPWLINPLLGGIAILLAHRLVQRLYNRQVADGTVLLLSLSPWLLFLSASLMPHALALVCALLGLLGVERARETGSLVWAGIAGLAVGTLLHVRSLEAIIVAVVAGLWWLSAGWKKMRFAALMTTCAVGMVMVGLYLAYDRALTGDPWQIPMNKFLDQTYYKGADRLGFGRGVGNFGWTGLDALPGHGPIDVVMNTNQNIYLANFEQFGWSCGSLLFVFLMLVRGRVRDDSLMWGLIFATWCGLSLYWFSGGPDFGPRYWYLMVVPIAVLTIRGAQFLASRLQARNVSPLASQGVWAFVVLASLLGFLNLVPWRTLDKYHNYRGVGSDIRRLESQYHFGRSLILVRGPGWPDYAAAIPFNPPDVDTNAPGPIFARDLNPESRRNLTEHYADRPVWIVAGPTETGAGFSVIAGPISPKQAESIELSQY